MAKKRGWPLNLALYTAQDIEDRIWMLQHAIGQRRGQLVAVIAEKKKRENGN